MENLHFKKTINATPEKVWRALWDDKSYREWTAVFAAGSKAVSNWKEGSTVQFLDGEGSGMVSEISSSIPNEFMSFKHLRSIRNGVEVMDDPQDKIWEGSFENYTLKNMDGKTELTIDLESKGMDEKMMDSFKKMWPKALDKLQEVAER